MFLNQHRPRDNSDLVDNPSTRCACMLVLDTSGSMAGAPITELNAGLQDFLKAVNEDEIASFALDLGVITAGGTVREILPFASASAIDGLETLDAQGQTPLGRAVQFALDRLEQRKGQYKANGVAYYQPWLVIISDGAPTDAWQAAATQARQLSEQRRLVVMSVGVQGANLDILGQFSSRPAKQLSGLKFREFFQWLSASMSRVSSSNSTSASVSLPKTDSWDSI
jgi:uncharacterized protein YegL